MLFCIRVKSFTSKTQKIGEIGEEVAVKFLTRKGFSVLERNYTISGGEIDIVAREKDKYLFCEVKAINVSRNRETWPVWQNLNKKKIFKLEKTMKHYVRKYGLVLGKCELVGILVFLNQEKRMARCELIRPLI